MGCLLYDGYYNFDEWVSCVCWFPLNIVSKRIVSNLKQHDAFHLCVLKEMCSVRLVLVHLPFAVATENVREARIARWVVLPNRLSTVCSEASRDSG